MNLQMGCLRLTFNLSLEKFNVKDGSTGGREYHAPEDRISIDSIHDSDPMRD
jgi:hypothetical protein